MAEILSTFLTDKATLSTRINDLYNNININQSVLIHIGYKDTTNKDMFYRIKVSNKHILSSRTSAGAVTNHDIKLEGQIAIFKTEGFLINNFEGIYHTLKTTADKHKNGQTLSATDLRITYFKEYVGELNNIIQSSTVEQSDNIIAMLLESDLEPGYIWDKDVRPNLWDAGLFEMYS